MRKFINGLLLGKSIHEDIRVARDCVFQARERIRTDRDAGRPLLNMYADGLEQASVLLADHTRSTPSRILFAKGFDNKTLDGVYRWALEACTKANARVRSPDPREKHEAIMLTGGCLLIGHLFRLRFIERQVTGALSQQVHRAVSEVQELITDLMTFAVKRSEEASAAPSGSL